MPSNEHFLQMAIDEAIQSVHAGQAPFGTVIVKDNAIIAAAHNKVWESMDPSAHAEIVAIRLACHKRRTIDLSGCILYSSCEPCPMCFSAIHWAKISTVFFSAHIADAKTAGFSELSIAAQDMKRLGNSPVEVHGGLLAEEGKAPFTCFLSQFKPNPY